MANHWMVELPFKARLSPKSTTYHTTGNLLNGQYTEAKVISGLNETIQRKLVGKEAEDIKDRCVCRGKVVVVMEWWVYCHITRQAASFIKTLRRSRTRVVILFWVFNSKLSLIVYPVFGNAKNQFCFLLILKYKVWLHTT